MKALLILCSALGASFFAFLDSARAGGVSDGGGNAVVCRDANENIVSATLLDLYEAEKVFRLRLLPNDSNKTYLQLALEAAERIDEGGAGVNLTYDTTSSVNGEVRSRGFGILAAPARRIIQDGISYIDRSINLIADAGLAPIDDSNTIIKPKNCQIEQTAIYLDSTDDIHVVEEIWNAFDSVNKAGLLVHEALYKIRRQSGETNSDRTRLAVGHAFAGSKFKHILQDIPQTVTICGTPEGAPKYRFAVYEENPGVTTLQFLWLHDKVMLSKTTVKVDTVSSPIGSLEPGSRFSIISSNIYESIFDKKLKIALENRSNGSGGFSSFVGLITNSVSENVLFQVTCNQTTFKCENDRCNSTASR